METDAPIRKGDGGYKAYYSHKSEDLQVLLSEKTQDVRRLEAQRNEENSKGGDMLEKYKFLLN